MAVFDVIDHESSSLNSAEVALDHSMLGIFFVSEFTDDIWCRRFDRPEVVFFLAGKLNYDLVHARVFHYNIHLWEPTEFYRHRPGLLNKLHHGISKPKLFDALLGRPKPHRDQIYRDLDRDTNIVTRFNDDCEKNILTRTKQEFVWPQDVDAPESGVFFTREQVRIDDVWISISRLIPYDIYNSTYYSIVAETMDRGNWSLFSEKITKPILARRLFLVSSSQYYLRNLKGLGFQTFADIIDESYDQEPDDQKRVGLMLDQMRFLSAQDPKKIMNKIESITEYNFNVLWHNEWQKNMLHDLKLVMVEFAK